MEFVAVSFLRSLLLLVSLYRNSAVEGKVVDTVFIISEGLVSPDNFVQKGILINGQFPGPPITVNKYDTLVVRVVNLLNSTFTLHMHGLHQRSSVEADGAPHITQAPILPNTTYVYRVDIGHQSGTFLYHAHTGLDLVWAFGALIIRDDHNERKLGYYVEERTLLLSQCWHVPISEIFKGLVGSPFQDVPETSSLLINGRSWGSWEEEQSKNVSIEHEHNCNANTEPIHFQSEGYEVITVKQNETYRFRVIALGMDAMLKFSIENHTALEIIEVDGVLVDPVETDYLQMNSAQRYSVLIKMDQEIGNYWINSEMLPGPGPRNGKAILHYEGSPDPSEMRTLQFPGEAEEHVLEHWVLEQLHPANNLSIKQMLVYPVPETVDREIIISSFQKVVTPTNQTQFDINGRLHRHSGPSLLHQVLAGQNITANEKNGVFEIFLEEKVQIIFQNRMSDEGPEGEGKCEQHPWHFHGHTFYVVGQGPDQYDPVADARQINEDILSRNGTGFLFRDVVTLFPAQSVENVTAGAACGWIAVRFVADNPGLWLAHCHITPHQIMGKWFVLYEHAISKRLY